MQALNENNHKVGLQKATSVDVARLVGVSQSTVSRTFSNDHSVAAKTREKILEAAHQLGYTPNAIARSLSTRQTNMVGIVMSNITSPFQPYVLEKFIQELQKLGRQVLVFTAGPKQEIDDILPVVMQYQLDALIVTSVTLSSERLSEFSRVGTPVILFNRRLPGENVSVVCCDNVEGGRLVANLLLDRGYKHLAYIAGSENSSTNRDRHKGFVDRLDERGLVKPLLRQPGQYSYEAGYEAAGHLLERDDPPDAIFCASDITALGVLDRARELQIKVPNELGIVGFDDIPMASWSAYALTTVRQPVEQMIDATLQMLLTQLRTTYTEPLIKLFPGVLVERQSTRPANNLHQI